MATKNAITEAARDSLMEHAGAISGQLGVPAPVQPVGGMTQVRSPYATAVHVTRPRHLQSVLARCKEEAAIAGDDFYYSWKQAGKVIEGPSIQAALAMVRNFGNCAVDTRVDENPDSYIFTATFIDLETGFNISRTFRQNKVAPKTKSGEDIYSGDRGQDVIFQIGQSKAIRNVILNALPSYLSNKVMEMAKANVIEQLKKMGKEKARGHVIERATALGVQPMSIEAVYGRSGGWDETVMVQILSAVRQIEDGIEKAEDLFPAAVGTAEVLAEAGVMTQPAVAAANVTQSQPPPSKPTKASKAQKEKAAAEAPKAEAPKAEAPKPSPKTYDQFVAELENATTHKQVTDVYAEIHFSKDRMTAEQHKDLVNRVSLKTKALGK